MPRIFLFTLSMICLVSIPLFGEPLDVPDLERFGAEKAERMKNSAETTLAPVYGPLAEWLVRDFNLADQNGIGIDLGGGPGSLIVELCRRTEGLHWINADINTYFFPIFSELVEKTGFGHRCSAIFADAQRMPFRNDYADVIVSRGSFPFWGDQKMGFSEVFRVLKPGGVAIIGRGFPPGFSFETAQEIRGKQKGSKILKYDSSESADHIRNMLVELNIKDFEILLPQAPGNSDLNYGLWVVIRKAP